jgi:hypothetical protein
MGVLPSLLAQAVESEQLDERVFRHVHDLRRQAAQPVGDLVDGVSASVVG